MELINNYQVPERYKKTEVGVIPDDWDVVLISELTSEVGDGIHSTPIYSSKGDYHFINGNNLVDGEIVISQDTKKADLLEFKKYKKFLNDRSILLSINGTIGNLAFYKGELIILGKSAAYLNIKDNFSKKYVYFALQTKSVKRFFEEGLTGTTIRNLGLGTIRNTPIAIPKDYKEQKAIAQTLSDVDALIAALDKLIAKKRNIKTGTMQQLLTGKTRLPGFGEGKGYKKTEVGVIPEDWNLRRLGEVAKITMGQSPSSKYYNYKNIGIPLIQGNADIVNRYAVIRAYTSVITKKCNPGDIIMSVRAPVGHISKTNFEACIGRGVCSISYENNFLYHLLVGFESQWFKLSKGSTFDSINSDEIKSLSIAIPVNKEEQKAIAQVLSDIDTEITALEKRRAKTQAIKQGMMQELLTGRTRLINN